MGIEKRQTSKNCLTAEQWTLSQLNETGFWKSQKAVNNLEQQQRNRYYRGALEDSNTIAMDFFAQDFTRFSIMDVGSGPEGILHVLKAEFKLAIDPLMLIYLAQGYKIGANNVMWLNAEAETFIPCINPLVPIVYDYSCCLNALDHMRDPAKAIENIAKFTQDEFLLITDLRTENQLDVYHRLAVNEKEVLSWLKLFFTISDTKNFPHQAGNPVRQLIVRCKK